MDKQTAIAVGLAGALAEAIDLLEKITRGETFEAVDFYARVRGLKVALSRATGEIEGKPVKQMSVPLTPTL